MVKMFIRLTWKEFTAIGITVIGGILAYKLNKEDALKALNNAMEVGSRLVDLKRIANNNWNK